jgi:hypothetical protein
MSVEDYADHRLDVVHDVVAVQAGPPSNAKRGRVHRCVSSPYTSRRAWSTTIGTMYSSSNAKMWQ